MINAFRNAALQLYGAVVPRMVGQKKVRDDSSTLNSLTASEFLSRHTKLADYLLQLLQNVKESFENLSNGENYSENVNEERDLTGDVSPNNDETVLGKTNKEALLSLNEHSHLVPVLSLLARLSPGTGLQQSQEVINRLCKYDSVILHLLKSPIHTVRRLAAISLSALTPSENAVKTVNSIINSFYCNNLSANEMHGKLLAISNFLSVYPGFLSDGGVKEPLILALKKITKTDRCYINTTLALKILKSLNASNLEISVSDISMYELGASQYMQTTLKLKIRQMSDEDLLKFLIEDVFSWQSVEEHFIDHLESYLHNQTSNSWIRETEAAIWQKLENRNASCTVLLVRILCLILNKQNRIEKMPSEKCIENLLLLLKGCRGAKIASKTVIIIAYIIKNIHVVERTELSVEDTLICEFCSVISKYSNPSSTEDYRLAASEALRIAAPAVLLNYLGQDIVVKEQVIVAVLDLLQDEDSLIRESSCQIVFALQEIFLLDVNHESYLKSQICEVVHPNLSVRYFLEIVAEFCVNSKNWELLHVLWTLAYQDKACEYQPKLSLFQSQAMNLYKEPRYCGEYISTTIEKTVREHFEERRGTCEKLGPDNDFIKWLHLEREALNQHGNFLKTLLKEQDNLLFDKWLLSAIYMYLDAYETLVSVGNIFSTQTELSCPFSVEEGSFCDIKVVI